jgi:glycosyltransferase involved in cell wall biosynthesis
LAFLGRIAPEKRPDRAIEIAKRSGVPLKIAAKVDKVDEGYFRDTILPLLNHPLIEFIGEIDDQEKCSFLGGALALLFPIDWPEPFGLVMIEAMSAGTPVIAWRNGSVPEVVDHGVSGWLVASMDEAVASVAAVQNMRREEVRQRFEARFTAQSMARAYIEAYEALLAKQTPILNLVPETGERILSRPLCCQFAQSRSSAAVRNIKFDPKGPAPSWNH